MGSGSPSIAEMLAVVITGCGWCGAVPGEWCRVAKGRTKGRKTHFLHAGRTYEVYDATGAEYCDGARDAYASIVRLLETPGADPWSLATIRVTDTGEVVVDPRVLLTEVRKWRDNYQGWADRRRADFTRAYEEATT